MTTTQAKLASELAALVPTGQEAEAAERLALAYAVYAADAEAATPILEAGVEAGQAAMEAALVGMSAPGAGAVKLEAGVKAFWAAVALGLATSFAGATAITPPPFTGLALAIQATFDANLAGGASLEDAADALAATIHAALPGGTVTTPGPTVTPIA